MALTGHSAPSSPLVPSRSPGTDRRTGGGDSQRRDGGAITAAGAVGRGCGRTNARRAAAAAAAHLCGPLRHVALGHGRCGQQQTEPVALVQAAAGGGGGGRPAPERLSASRQSASR